jgi:hypothetical protein
MVLLKDAFSNKQHSCQMAKNSAKEAKKVPKNFPWPEKMNGCRTTDLGEK